MKGEMSPLIKAVLIIIIAAIIISAIYIYSLGLNPRIPVETESNEIRQGYEYHCKTEHGVHEFNVMPNYIYILEGKSSIPIHYDYKDIKLIEVVDISENARCPIACPDGKESCDIGCIRHYDTMEEAGLEIEYYGSSEYIMFIKNNGDKSINLKINLEYERCGEMYRFTGSDGEVVWGG